MTYKFKWPDFSDILMTALAAALCGLGVGAVNRAGLGFDPIGVFYDGIRNILGLTAAQLGIATYIANGALMVFLWFAARKYVSVGTIIYIALYGLMTDEGSYLAGLYITTDTIWAKIILTVVGLALLYIGLGTYVAIDIGVDSFTGVVLYLRDITGKEMRHVKIACDVFVMLLGLAFGGHFSIVTVVTAFVGGPCIQFVSGIVEKVYFKGKIKKYKKDESA